MTAITIYHNQNCSKSRGAKCILDEKGVETDVIEYLTTPPDADTIRHIISILEGEPKDMLHAGLAEKAGINLEEANSPDAIVAILADKPEIMNRPICIKDDRAIIARPSEKISELL